jgi:hypothetical protein
MDISAIIGVLREQLHSVNQSIVALERMERGSDFRPGRLLLLTRPPAPAAAPSRELSLGNKIRLVARS